jgi:GH24 family phage-related lysozyme (muramidase)
MDANLFQRMRQHIIDNEGRSPTPYRDSAGLLTAGYGFKVDSADAFAKLPFQVKDAQSGETRPATEAEKRAEFDRISSFPQKQLGKEAKGGKAFHLTKDDMDSKLASEIAAREAKIKAEVGAANWDRMNDGQKTAVLDVHYANGSLANFPDLKQAIKDGNAEEIGRNVDFHGTNPDKSWQYNEGRLARNRAAAQGISEEDAKRSVEDDMKSGKLGRKNKTSDASDGTDEAPPKLTSTSIGELSTTSIAALDIPPATSVKGDLLETTSPQDSNVGGLANEAQETAQAMEVSEQTANADSRIAAMREMAAQPMDHPGKSALLKPVDKWTESEMKDVLNSAQGDFTGWQSGDPLKARMYETVQDWHSSVYGDGEQRYDGGKPIDPQPTKPLNIVAMPHTTPQGEDLWKASTRMGDKIGTIAETDGYTPAIDRRHRRRPAAAGGKAVRGEDRLAAGLFPHAGTRGIPPSGGLGPGQLRKEPWRQRGAVGAPHDARAFRGPGGSGGVQCRSRGRARRNCRAEPLRARLVQSRHAGRNRRRERSLFHAVHSVR